MSHLHANPSWGVDNGNRSKHHIRVIIVNVKPQEESKVLHKILRYINREIADAGNKLTLEAFEASIKYITTLAMKADNADV